MKNDGVYVYFTFEELIKYIRWLNGESTKEISITRSTDVDMIYNGGVITDGVHIDCVSITD